ncbi:hypothetical protein V1517DRAFT_363813 [Lipomyces orientalis]|uniref:Uncharacterized protein n=1 Tax=Lipomyces orientalis TaxID=1233043 RepID=A0ACC3TIV2_9ASCO
MVLSYLTVPELCELQLVCRGWDECLFQFFVDRHVRRGQLDLQTTAMSDQSRERDDGGRLARTVKATRVASVTMAADTAVAAYRVLLGQQTDSGGGGSGLTTELDGLRRLRAGSTFGLVLDDWKRFGVTSTIVPNQLTAVELPLVLIQQFYEFVGSATSPSKVVFASLDRLAFTTTATATAAAAAEDDKRWADFSPDCFKRKFVVLPAVRHLAIVNRRRDSSSSSSSSSSARAAVNHRALDFVPMWMPQTETVTCGGLELYCRRSDDATRDAAYRADFSSLGRLRAVRIVDCQLWLAPRLPSTCACLCLDGTAVRIAVRGRPRLNESYDAFEYNEPGATAAARFDRAEWPAHNTVDEYAGLGVLSVCSNPWLGRFQLWFVTGQCGPALRRLDLYGTPLTFLGPPQAQDGPEFDLLRNLIVRCPSLEYLGLGRQPTVKARHAYDLVRLRHLAEVCLVRTAVAYRDMVGVLDALAAAGRELRVLYYDAMTADQHAHMQARFAAVDIRREFTYL